MNSKMKGFMMGVSCTLILTCTSVVNSLTIPIEAYYKDFKIYIDREPLVILDSEGNKSNPIICNNISYVPLRTVASHCKKPIQWDPKSESIYIGKSKELLKLEHLTPKMISEYLSNEFDAPKELLKNVTNDLKTIKENYSEKFPNLKDITFVPSYGYKGYLTLEFDDESIKLVKENKYSAWNKLNNKFEMKSQGILVSNYVHLRSDKDINNRKLRDLYQELPGIKNVNSDLYMYNGSDIHPGVYGNERVYLFFYGKGDCPSGCSYKEYWYFKTNGDNVNMIGHWIASRVKSKPIWWDEAELLMNN